jgi:hypothetical protein
LKTKTELLEIYASNYLQDSNGFLIKIQILISFVKLFIHLQINKISTPIVATIP